jgi:hypothetical protein
VIGCGQPPAIAACTRREHSTTDYMESLIPPSVLSWNDKDGNCLPSDRPGRWMAFRRKLTAPLMSGMGQGRQFGPRRGTAGLPSITENALPYGSSPLPPAPAPLETSASTAPVAPCGGSSHLASAGTVLGKSSPNGAYKRPIAIQQLAKFIHQVTSAGGLHSVVGMPCAWSGKWYNCRGGGPDGSSGITAGLRRRPRNAADQNPPKPKWAIGSMGMVCRHDEIELNRPVPPAPKRRQLEGSQPRGCILSCDSDGTYTRASATWPMSGETAVPGAARTRD